MHDLPSDVTSSPHSTRLAAALVAVRSAGAALLEMRGGAIVAAEVGDQLKSAADLAAEGWILGYLRGQYPDDAVLSEERYETDQAHGISWIPRDAYWVLDALDGTRSYMDGFDTFCVQLAWIADGEVQVGVIHEPVAGATYIAVRGAGAYRLDASGHTRLSVPQRDGWPESPRFVDSTPPAGVVGDMMREHRGVFVECGSIGLKICRVADGSADVYAKPLRFKLWDVAPGELVLNEAGGKLAQWSGEKVDTSSGRIFFQDILVAGPELFPLAASEIAAG